MRIYEILEARQNPTTIYDNGTGETMHVEDRGPKYRLMGTDHRFYGWTNRYDMEWDSEEEMEAWLNEKGFRVVGWESVEEEKGSVPAEIISLIKKDPTGSKGLLFRHIQKNWGWDYGEAERATKKYYMKYSDVVEGEVIDTKFQQKLAQKKGMFYNPDAEPPVSRTTGEPYVRFETEPMPSGKSAAIIGVLADGTREEISFTKADVADALAKAYNAGGYSTQNIKRVPLGDVFK